MTVLYHCVKYQFSVATSVEMKTKFCLVSNYRRPRDPTKHMSVEEFRIYPLNQVFLCYARSYAPFDDAMLITLHTRTRSNPASIFKYSVNII